MTAFRYEAVDARGQVAPRSHRRGDRAPGARPAARRRALSDRDRRPRTTATPAGGRAHASSRSVALARHAPARDAHALRHAARPGARRRRRAGRRRAGRRRCSPACAPRSPRASRSPARWRAGRGRFPSSIADSSPSARRPGRLPDVLARLADYLEAREALRQKFTLALIYPALVTVIALAVIAVLLAYVVPQVVSVYQQSRQTLPWLTQALIAMSGFFRATGWYWLAAHRRGAVPRSRSPIAAPRSARAGTRRCCGCPSPAGCRRDRHGALREHARDPDGKRRAAPARARRRARRRVVAAVARRRRRIGAPRARRRVARPRAQGAEASFRRC